MCLCMYVYIYNGILVYDYTSKNAFQICSLDVFFYIIFRIILVQTPFIFFIYTVMGQQQESGFVSTYSC